MNGKMKGDEPSTDHEDRIARPLAGGVQAAMLIACGALLEAAEYFERFADVNDGDYGAPEPNEASRLLAGMEAALAAMAAVQRQPREVTQ